MRYTLLILMLAGICVVSALPTYVPVTTIAEDFGASWCPGCLIAWQGLQEVHNQTHNGEFISARLYTESGDLSNPQVQARFDYYEVIGVPAIIFNGKIQIDGSDVGIGDGTLYMNALKQFRFSSSPVKVQITDFLSTTGRVSGSVQMISPTENIVDGKVIYFLVEDNVSADDTQVVRSILYDTLNLTGEGNVFNFDKFFTINPAWNAANLWVIASVQLANETILQSASTLPLPTYNFRCAMDWNPAIVGQANTNYASQPYWFFNLGAGFDYTMSIAVDSAPADWFFNYCSEDGNCFPGNTEIPFSIGAGETVPFHLNLSIGSPGIANFRVVVTSPSIGGAYSIPFRYATEGMADSDHHLVNPAIKLGNIYPNPFAGNAELDITSDKNIPSATIEVFNLKGQKVQEVSTHPLVQGSNRIPFSADGSLANGVYFYRLSGSKEPARRFVLIR